MLTNKTFPDYLAPDEEKAKNEYGLKYAKSIEYQWFHRPENGKCNYYTKRDEYHRLRLYARGEQSADLYKKLLAGGNNSTYTNYDWRPLQIIPKFVKLITNQMAERLYEVKAEAVDKYSTDLKEKHKQYLESVVAAKPIYQLAQETFGENIAPPNIDELPETNEEVELHMALKYKPAIEIAAETAIKFTLDLNDYNETQSRVIEDLTVIGIGCTKHTTDPSKGILVDYVDPANLVYSYPTHRDFKDVHYFGEVKRITIHDLKRISGETFTDEQIRQFGLAARNWSSYHGIMTNQNTSRDEDLDNIMVDVLYFTFKSLNTVTYKKKLKNNGGYSMTKKDSTFKLKKGENDGYEVVKKSIDVWYEGGLVLGTDQIFNYKLCENMVRPNGHLNLTMPSYSMYAPELYQNRTTSLVGRIIGYVDQMQQIHIKLQQLIAKARPNGIYIDIDGINEINMGDGNFLTPLELIKIYDETGNVLGTSLTTEGDYNYGKEPIRELKNGVVDGLDRMINAYNHYLNLLRDAIGIPQGADASMPHPDTLVGVQNQVALNSNTATRHILEGSLTITKNIAKGLSLRLKDIFKYSELKEVYINAVGKLGVQALEAIQDYALYDFGINIELKPDAEEKQYLEQNIQTALSRDLISLPDAIDIRSIGNIKLANRVIEIRIRKREKEKSQQELAMIKANADSQVQSTQVAAQLKMQQTQAEAGGKIELENTKTEGAIRVLEAETMLKERLMEKEFQYNMQLRGVEVSSKQGLEEYKEDRKDNRTKIQATQQSKLDEAKRYNQPAINFESSEDNLAGSMNLEEMNPS